MKISSKIKGGVLIFFALLLPVLLAFGALAVDLWYIQAVHSKLKAAADSAALAGASGIYFGEAEVRNRVIAYAAKNKINNKPVDLLASDIVLGVWDPTTQVFTPIGSNSNLKPNAVQVDAELSSKRGTGLNLFLAKSFGIATTDLKVSSTAVYGPRDIMLSLDFSKSMNVDSTLDASSIAKLGRSVVEQNVLNIWRDLGSPNYGNLKATLPQPKLTGNSSQILKTLGLKAVPYPYSKGGSWSDYISYVKNLSDSHYEDRYGYLTLMNYWQNQYSAHSQIPDLWKTREQPVQSVKDAVGLFIQYLKQYPTNDNLGLNIFTYTDNRAKLEVSLTTDFNRVQTVTGQRQAGHYISPTNIAAGIQSAITELKNNGRPGATQIIVLLSDGQPNWTSSGSTSTAAAKTEALNQAKIAAANQILILTISLGSQADTALMQQIADATKGVHYIVPGGSSINSYRDQLNEVFAKIAAYRPLKLIH
jgi:Mg-chelatase subunit ChlD